MGVSFKSTLDGRMKGWLWVHLSYLRKQVVINIRRGRTKWIMVMVRCLFALLCSAIILLVLLHLKVLLVFRILFNFFIMFLITGNLIICWLKFILIISHSGSDFFNSIFSRWSLLELLLRLAFAGLERWLLHFQWEIEFLIHLGTLPAIFFEIRWHPPRILTSHEFSHVLHLVAVSLHLGLLYHVFVYVNKIHNSLILVYRRWLVWSESDLTVYYEVIIVESLFHILYR